MKVSKFSDSQIASILTQAESGVPVPALRREHGISSATFYNWRSKYAGLDANLMSRLKALEAEVIPPKRAASKSRINTSPAFSAGRVSLLKPSYAFALE